MRQWKSLVPALHLHVPAAAAASCFPHPPSPSPCSSPPREEEDVDLLLPPPPPQQQDGKQKQQQCVVRLVGCDGRVRAYAPPVTARELMQQHPRHLVCRADALLIGEKIPAVAPGEELQPGQAYFLLPAHLFHSVLSFVSLASSLLLLLSTAGAAGKAAAGKQQQGRPFELHRTASGTLQIKFSDDFLVGGGCGVPDETKAAAAEDKPKPPGVLRGDARLAKDYEELVGYSKSRRWAPKLETIEEVVVVAAAAAAAAASSESSAAAAAASSTPERSSRRSRALPFLGRLGSRRRRDGACSGGSAVACSG